jgi:hypothetical protein
LIFEYRLARELGKTRCELLQTISQSEFIDWLALQSIDPFFDGWMANAVNCQMTAAAVGSKIAIEKFLPVRPARRPPTPTEIRAIIRGRSKSNGSD